MRQTSFLAGLGVLVFAVSIAAGQGIVFNGIPASVTSVTPAHPNPGIPASVTSVRPALPGEVGFRGGFRPDFGHHRRDHDRVVAVPVAVPLYYPYAYDNPADYPDNAQAQPGAQPVAMEPPAPTIFENRPGYIVPPVQASGPTTREETVQPSANQSVSHGSSVVAKEAVPEPEPTTILVFRDGHQLEIGNYAIVGNTLYNLTGNYRAQKILLADLDLDATAKVNEERGYEFRVPKPEGN